MKFIYWVAIPASSALIFILGMLADISYKNLVMVLGTFAILDTLLGLFYWITTRSWSSREMPYDGEIVIAKSDSGKKLYSLELYGEPEAIDEKKEVVFKVGPRLPPHEDDRYSQNKHDL